MRSQAGYTLIELIVGLGVMAAAMAATTGLFVASRNFMTDQALQVETTQAARATLDLLVRDLRLGGACLPVNGDFVSVDGINNGTKDEIITRTGLIRPDLSCVRTATTVDADENASSIKVDSVDGFTEGMRGYLRGTNGIGQFFTIDTVNGNAKTIQISPSLSEDYALSSGVYAIDERRYFIKNWDGVNTALYTRLNAKESSDAPFAIGVEKLDITYQLERNCPPCDIVQLPATDAEWATVDQIFLTITAKSLRANAAGQFYRRSVTVGVKPRNLLPQ